MSGTWQQLIVMAVIIAAAVHVIRSVVNALRGSKRGPGCGAACGDCPSTPANTPLVQLEHPADEPESVTGQPARAGETVLRQLPLRGKL